MATCTDSLARGCISQGSLRAAVFTLALAAMFTGEASAQSGKAMDPGSRLNKIVGAISQIKDGGLIGNAWFYGKDGCFVVTNYHVAFGKAKRSVKHPLTGKDVEKLVLVDNPGVGHPVTLNFDLNPKTNEFTRRVSAAVAAFGNYEEGTVDGIAEDIVLLRLNQCAGSDYAGIEVDRTEANQRNPAGHLLMVSSTRTADGKTIVASQSGCKATEETPGAGLIGHSCETSEGTSGSMMLA